mgnify:CR=1 FL=1
MYETDKQLDNVSKFDKITYKNTISTKLNDIKEPNLIEMHQLS